MNLINFLFNGTWGMLPKFLFWFFLGIIICSVIEWGGNDGVPLSSWLWVIGGTILGAYSLYLSVKSER